MINYFYTTKFPVVNLYITDRFGKILEVHKDSYLVNGFESLLPSVNSKPVVKYQSGNKYILNN